MSRMGYALVVGDIIKEISADNTILDFQPAVGIEVVITVCSGNGGPQPPRFFDGANDSQIDSTAAGWLGGQPGNAKIFIDNGLFIRYIALGAGQFSAIAGMEIG